MHFKNQETALSPNGRGAQPYLSRDIIDDSNCPLSRGETVVAELIPRVGVILRPKNSPEIVKVDLDD